MKTIRKIGMLTALSILAASHASANLVINGDFEAGNQDFTSAYTYVAPTGNTALWNEGTYTVHTSASDVHSSWTYGPTQDHTATGPGNMLIVNGSTTPQTTPAWQGTLSSPIIAGQSYVLSAWVANIFPDAPSKLEFFIGTTQVGSIQLGAPDGNWHHFSATFTAGSGVPNFFDSITAYSGNDFAVDDICLTAVPEPTTMIAGALLLIPFGASTLRVLRRNQKA